MPAANVRNGRAWTVERPINRISQEGRGKYVPTLGPPLTPAAIAEITQLWADLHNEAAILDMLPHRWHARAELLIQEIRREDA